MLAQWIGDVIGEMHKNKLLHRNWQMKSVGILNISVRF